MASCEVCGKKPSTGNRVSHSNHRAGRWWQPNVHRLRLTVGGRRRPVYVCARCLRSHHHIRPT
ncbi:MAG: 50S ribosomal protein L28 [Chloroflexi bacterium]|nr:50S ribosomal protein L28 [Chloroflexota bacterium]